MRREIARWTINGGAPQGAGPRDEMREIGTGKGIETGVVAIAFVTILGLLREST